MAARFYFLVSFVDAYSRYVVHHKLLISHNGQSVAIELQQVLESMQGAKPRIVHDHGSEFVNRDVAAVIKTHNLIDIRTRRRHSESNGIVERFHGTMRHDSDDDYGNRQIGAILSGRDLFCTPCPRRRPVPLLSRASRSTDSARRSSG